MEDMIKTSWRVWNDMTKSEAIMQVILLWSFNKKPLYEKLVSDDFYLGAYPTSFEKTGKE